MKMSELNDVLTFGKHKGKMIADVYMCDPSYLCWMRKSGYADFSESVLKRILAWEERNPKEVNRVERSIVKARFDKNTSSKTAKAETQPVAEIRVNAALSDPLFGSW